MNVKIFPIAMGFDQCYVLKSEGVVAVDAGAPGKAKSFTRGIDKAGIPPHEVQLLVLTHGHWDHIGCAQEIKEMTGAKVALHNREANWLESSLKPMPPGVTPWGRIFTRLVAVFMPWVHVPPTSVDLKLGDEGLSLSEYGIPGRVIHTPGHSSGSVSVLLESGEVFVGDLAMNKFPLRLTPGLPILAEDASQVRQTWKQLLEEGATTIYPAHGRPFPSEVIRKALP